MFKKYILPYFVFYLFKILRFTWKIKIIEAPQFRTSLNIGEPLTIGMWHGDEIALSLLLDKYKLAAMISTSNDGNLMNKVVELFGMKTSRGSSTRGAISGLKGLLKFTKSGYMTVFAVDGPKGPYHIVKPGIFELSKITKSKIVPIGVYANKSFVFKKSWNKTYLPLPFSKIIIHWGEPLPFIDRALDPRDPVLAKSLASSLDALHQRSRNLIAGPPIG